MEYIFLTSTIIIIYFFQSYIYLKIISFYIKNKILYLSLFMNIKKIIFISIISLFLFKIK